MSLHTCPVKGCFQQVPGTKLMCVRHWRMVSKPVGDELYAAYRAGAHSMRHYRAINTAIAEVDALVAPAGKEQA